MGPQLSRRSRSASEVPKYVFTATGAEENENQKMHWLVVSNANTASVYLRNGHNILLCADKLRMRPTMHFWSWIAILMQMRMQFLHAREEAACRLAVCLYEYQILP